MSENSKDLILQFSADDPEMQRAFARAQSSFRFFWRELSWENRRIIPALHLTAVKTVFADRPLAASGPDNPAEQMWLKDIEFDGRTVSGSLLNQPRWLSSIQAGARCSFPFDQLTDWIYAFSGRAYGAFTVQVMRSRMNLDERQQHDSAWGLDFGDPSQVLIDSNGQTDDNDETEHPMSANMRPSLIKHLEANPNLINEPDDQGWTILHYESLAGNSLLVETLLELGADKTLQTNAGDQAIDLARIMRWQKIIKLLSS